MIKYIIPRPPQRLLLAVITISIEIHFTTLYMADLGTRADCGGEYTAMLLSLNRV